MSLMLTDRERGENNESRKPVLANASNPGGPAWRHQRWPRRRAQPRGGKLPDQIKWSEPDARGVQNAVLVGDPSKPGFYAVMTKWLKGNHFSRPHFHPNDRYITVLQGTWWVGSGPKFDPANTTPMPAGSFVTHFGKQVHWDGAKDEDAVLLIMGEGPGTSTAAEEK
jgi:hypothetical protein